MKTLFERTSLGSLSVRNRFVRSATWLGLANDDGSCSDRLIDATTRLAEGGVGLIITEFCFVTKDSQTLPHQMAVHADSHIPALKRMTDAVHGAGGKIVLQLTHGGVYSQPGLTGCEPSGPSPLEADKGPLGRAMTADEIRATVLAFGDAAGRAARAGFDGIEIHAGHGFLLSQFLSPFFNKRTDDYGGSLANRARILLEVVASIRHVVSDRYPVLAKVNSDDFLEGGFVPGEMVGVAQMLQRAGVDGIEVSGGTFYGFKVGNPDITFSPVGKDGVYYEEAARHCKAATSLPVVLVGGIRSLETSRRLVEENVADCVALCRPLIREPDLIRRWESGDAANSACLSDDSCIQPGLAGRGVYCVHARGLRSSKGLLRFYSGSSGAVNTKRAVAECLEDALGEGDLDCDLVIFHTTMGHNFPDILSEMHRLSPSARIVGTTCAGVIGREGPNESMRALAIMAVRGPREAFAVAGMAMGPDGLSREAGARIALALKAENPRINMVLFHHTAIAEPGGMAWFREGVESVFGPGMPIFGALSMDSMKLVTDFQFLDDQVFEQGAVGVGFADPTLEVICQANHGFTPIGEPFTVTRATETALYELDGIPAWKALTGRLGLSEYAHPMEVVAYAEIAAELPPELHEEYGSKYIIRAGGIRRKDGSLSTNGKAAVGEKLYLLQRDEKAIAEGVERLAAQVAARCSGRRPVAVFHADCAARGKASFRRILKDEIVRSMQYPICGDESVPWLGMYGAGELCMLGGRNMNHSFTTSLYVIVERESA